MLDRHPSHDARDGCQQGYTLSRPTVAPHRAGGAATGPHTNAKAADNTLQGIIADVSKVDIR